MKNLILGTGIVIIVIYGVLCIGVFEEYKRFIDRMEADLKGLR